MSVLDDYMVDPRHVAAGQDADPGPGAGADAAGVARGDWARKKLTQSPRQSAARLVEAAVRRRGRRASKAIQRRKWAAPLHTALAEVTEREVTVEMRRQRRERRWKFDVTHCRFAEFFRSARRAGTRRAAGVRKTDFDIVAAGGDDVSLTRDPDPDAGRTALHVPLSLCTAVVNKLFPPSTNSVKNARERV